MLLRVWNFFLNEEGVVSTETNGSVVCTSELETGVDSTLASGVVFELLGRLTFAEGILFSFFGVFFTACKAVRTLTGFTTAAKLESFLERLSCWVWVQ